MVLDRDRSSESRSLVTAFLNTDTFALEDYAPDEETIREALARGTINAAVIVPPDYAEKIASGRPSVSVLLNGAESVPATAALRAIEGVGTELGLRIALERMGIDPDEVQGFLPSLRVWFNEALSEAYYRGAGFLAQLAGLVQRSAERGILHHPCRTRADDGIHGSAIRCIIVFPRA
jgi:hypothetical protein